MRSTATVRSSDADGGPTQKGGGVKPGDLSLLIAQDELGGADTCRSQGNTLTRPRRASRCATGAGLGRRTSRQRRAKLKPICPLSGCRKRPVTHRIATTTCATGFFNAIRVLILRREPFPLPVAKPTGFTTLALTALACKIAPICLIPLFAFLNCRHFFQMVDLKRYSL